MRARPASEPSSSSSSSQSAIGDRNLLEERADHAEPDRLIVDLATNHNQASLSGSLPLLADHNSKEGVPPPPPPVAGSTAFR